MGQSTAEEALLFEEGRPLTDNEKDELIAAGVLTPTSPAIRLIAAERQRQITEAGYTAEHDSGHGTELALAGAAYAVASSHPTSATNVQDALLDLWPWETSAWSPTGDAVRDLTKAGALIAAAIDSHLAARS